MSGRCGCKLGYVNISTNCVPLSSLTLMTLDPSKTVKAQPTCSLNQQYSSVLGKCVCVEGFSPSALNDSCIGICNVSNF